MFHFLAQLLYRDTENDEHPTCSLARNYRDNSEVDVAREVLFEFLKYYQGVDRPEEMHEEILEKLEEYTLSESDIHSGIGKLFVVQHTTNSFFECNIFVAKIVIE